MSGLYKLLLGFLLLANAGALAQCPPNIGFEDGTFTNWECAAGTIDGSGNIKMTSTGQINGRHTIISAAAQAGVLDAYGHFPVACPNGSKYSIKLGNEINGSQAERITYTFTVPPGIAYSLILNYAVVLQNPTHASYQQPKFTAQIYDITDGKYIDCPSFNFIASDELPGFKLSDIGSDPNSNGKSPSTIYYKDWSATTINLLGYAGKAVRLEFTTNDCTLGGHFGYAYLDVNENCEQAITGNIYCSGQNYITLHAPSGFYDYFWYTGDLKTQVGHGETLTFNPAPADQTPYALTIVPYPGLGCPDTLYTTITKINTPYKLNVVDTVYACEGVGVDLTAASVTAGSTPGLTYSYFTNPEADTYLYEPTAVTKSGTYYIKGVNPDGCQNVLPVYVKIANAFLTVSDPDPVTYPATVDLAHTYKSISGQTYGYYTDVNARVPLANFTKVDVSGTYYIKAVSSIGCVTVKPVKVVVIPPPPSVISAPNVFTPNNDGINDTFMVNVSRFVGFGDLKIFNRYGQLLYTAKSINDLWDGNYNNQQLPSGTYYWIFEGTDQYYHIPLKKAGSISIIR